MWIESHQSLRNHPKIKKAARLAGINEFEMIGRLHGLWWWALDYAPDGDLTNYSDDDIEDAVDWNGEHGAFIKALIECGFNGHCGLIEVTNESRVIHDWFDYAGKLLDRRAANAERMREARAKHVQGTQRARVGLPNQPTVPTVPNQQTVPDQPEDGADKPRKSRKDTQTEFIQWLEAQPQAVKVFVDKGGQFATGALKDGTPKRENAAREIAETVGDDQSKLDLWGRIVFEYQKQWSPKSYTVMLNEYFLKCRVPGITGSKSNSNGHSSEPTRQPSVTYT